MGARVRFLAIDEWLLSNSMKRSKFSGNSSGSEQCVSMCEGERKEKGKEEKGGRATERERGRERESERDRGR